MEMEIVRIGEVDLAYEIFGMKTNNDIILISGLGSQMIRWENSFCSLLVGKGFRVIRFDNRDAGSSVFNSQKEINSKQNIEEQFSTLHENEIPYSLTDMVYDVIGLLDHLKIDKVHIAGRSMGGIIGQLMASFYPARVRTLTIIMSTSLHPALPPPDPEIMQIMMQPGTDPVVDKEQYIKEKIDFTEKISGTLYKPDHNRERTLIEEELQRLKTKNGIIRQLMAIGSWKYNPEILKEIKVPTLVIHGTDDLIFHPDCGKDIAASIPDSELILIEGMGHSIPTELYGLICKSIIDLAQK
ncbi:alpha/beta hydrolase [Chryseobacterium lactis]|uniref:Alpha/beta hydrolase n=1 Tax=Chryseobacterium lactis TaxID=1241981 RepID=A0A3G6RFP0_CHRLC|nr:alpha/beta hydrolase [Chryseobacterium lactis]AZA82281.1 alpha/beta hydrolase [Chryseobacterium lactis]AZB02663.1 alpha/beta hydrolase [Chryseobacterium lactis]PNW14045.1 alpha/beta hydrolase [Chryseobacterium lactis]